MIHPIPSHMRNTIPVRLVHPSDPTSNPIHLAEAMGLVLQ
jgi:hypothetical protein